MRTTRLKVLGAAALAGACVAVAPATASASVQSCHWNTGGSLFTFRPVGGNRYQAYLSDLSVRNMTCGDAIRALHAAEALPGWPMRLRTPGFACYVFTWGGGESVDRCVRGDEAFRITLGT
jgi:hypothetical protein